MSIVQVRLASLVAAALALAACSLGAPAPTRYYVLSPTVAAPTGSPGASAGPSVELTRVTMPDYLNQSSILTRTRANDVQRAENDLWAGSLADEVTRTLSEDLSLALPTDRLSLGGTRRAVPTDFTVEVEIVSFERDEANTVHLVARWTVLRDDARRLVAMRRSVYQRSAGGSDYNSAVAAMSQALGDLSLDVANAIKANAGQPR
jgi:uncharacterized lipoprotein YmbA